MARPKNEGKAAKNSGATVGYGAKLWPMAGALRGSMDAAEYKHVFSAVSFSSTSPTTSRGCTGDSEPSCALTPSRWLPEAPQEATA